MNRENALFAACGFLLGIIVGAFFLGEMVHDARSGRRADVSATSSASPQQTTTGDVMTMVRAQIERLNQLLKVNPNNADALTQLGNLYMDAAKYSEAVTYYERALKIRKDPNVATDLGICYRELGEHGRALALFEQVRRENPTHWQALFNQAVVLVDMKQYDKAREAIAQLRRERPADPEIMRFQETLARIEQAR